MYSRGAAAIAEQIHSSVEEAQKIIDNFYKSFPTVKAWMDESLRSLKEKEYVEDFYGRRRRLPDINLPSYTVTIKDTATRCNPLLCCSDQAFTSPEAAAKQLKWENIVKAKVADYQAYRLKRAKEIGGTFEQTDEMGNKQYEAIAKEALADGVLLQAFTGRKAQAARQCVNARIQGSSATMTKIAMNKITNDPELLSYGFKLCIGVHDELIGEVKEEYAEQGAARLCEIMKTCVSDLMSVSFKCDPSIVSRWYEDEVAYQLQETYNDLIKSGKTETEARAAIEQSNPEFLPEEINSLLCFS